jgi:low affinity Fe/Cu permease
MPRSKKLNARPEGKEPQVRDRATRGPSHWLEAASRAVTQWTGSSWAFALAVLVVVVWLVTGPVFHYSDTWQLVINTGTTVVTFLMVFLIQRSQNKDSRAIHLKLNEIVAALEGASNRLVDVEDLSEEELTTLHGYFCALSDMAKRDLSVTRSHSIEEAVAGHTQKLKKHKRPAHK